MATEATAEAEGSGVGQLSERQVGVVRLDGERHALVWIRDAKRTVNVLIDRPSEGAGKVRLLARLFPEESTAAIEALIADYRCRHVDVPRAESDVAALLHRSGECNCAARGAWWRERDLIRALWPRWFAETIEALEADAEALGVRWCRWGGFDLAGVRAGTEAGERPGPLCADCALEQMPLLEGQVSRSPAPARR